MTANLCTNHIFVFTEDMSQPGGKNLRTVFTRGDSSAGASGPKMKKLRMSKKAAGTPTKSPAKEKEQPPAAQIEETAPPAVGGSMPPPLSQAPAFVRDTGAEPGASAIAPPEVRIPVDPQDLEKIPDVFRGTVYETANYAVSHFYRFNERELRAIETRSPVGVLESSLGMALTSALALHRSIARTKAQLEDMRGEHQAVVATHQTSLQTTKDALAAAQAELEEAHLKLQEVKATKAALAAARAELDTTKAGAEEAKAALEAEKAASGIAMEDMLYHCWAYNPDDDFSFSGADVWEPLLEGFKARLQKEAPSETGEASVAAEQEGETATSTGPTGGA
ncbi:uncharacterized protein LOC133801670 [Humulus lupulus]|uniref:uncharacterized protein LOC133801670 n=1 Tax=Humulus lupulus TaxID=3486 RepID=UPI002B4146E2|nr:uncharacterized protein LOC133801670 [Humulus lupulus]